MWIETDYNPNVPVVHSELAIEVYDLIQEYGKIVTFRTEDFGTYDPSTASVSAVVAEELSWKITPPYPVTHGHNYGKMECYVSPIYDGPVPVPGMKVEIDSIWWTVTATDQIRESGAAALYHIIMEN